MYSLTMTEKHGTQFVFSLVLLRCRQHLNTHLFLQEV